MLHAYKSKSIIFSHTFCLNGAATKQPAIICIKVSHFFFKVKSHGKNKLNCVANDWRGKKNGEKKGKKVYCCKEQTIHIELTKLNILINIHIYTIKTAEKKNFIWTTEFIFWLLSISVYFIRDFQCTWKYKRSQRKRKKHNNKRFQIENKYKISSFVSSTFAFFFIFVHMVCVNTILLGFLYAVVCFFFSLLSRV